MNIYKRLWACVSVKSLVNIISRPGCDNTVNQRCTKHATTLHAQNMQTVYPCFMGRLVCAKLKASLLHCSSWKQSFGGETPLHIKLYIENVHMHVY